MVAAVAEDGRACLTEPEAKAVLAAYGIPVPETVVALNEDAVEAAAARLLAERAGGGGQDAVQDRLPQIRHRWRHP